MTFSELILARRSARGYTEPASKDDIEAILKDAQRAPSWKNAQASRFYVVTEPDTLEKVRKALPSFNQTSSQNAALIVTAFVRGVVGHTAGAPDNELGDMWGAYDLGLHDAYLILAAKDRGYDTLIMGLRDADALRAALSIPENETIVSVIAIGRAEKAPDLRPRKDMGEVVSWR